MLSMTNDNMIFGLVIFFYIDVYKGVCFTEVTFITCTFNVIYALGYFFLHILLVRNTRRVA